MAVQAMPKKTKSPVGLAFGLKTLYLFICNYNVIVVVWATIGTICSKRLLKRLVVPSMPAAANTTLSNPIQDSYEHLHMFLGFDLIDTLKSFSLSFFWVAIVAMGFSISNQRQPASIHEDSLNKPWRPIPSQRITPSQANTLFSVVTVMGLVYSGLFGGLGPYLIQLAATYMYNDLGGAQGHHVIRDFLNAVGMTSWVFGCIDVAAGPGFHFTSADLIPSAVLAAAITTTIAIQDFRDFDGDRECGRATLPIAIGQGYARVLIAVSILSWSFGVVILLGSGLVSALTGLGTLIAMRLLFLRTRSADKITMEFWYGWFATLPLVLL